MRNKTAKLENLGVDGGFYMLTKLPSYWAVNASYLKGKKEHVGNLEGYCRPLMFSELGF